MPGASRALKSEALDPGHKRLCPGGGGGGGGGGTSIYVHIGYVPFLRPPFSALNFRSRAYHFHK